MREDWIECSLGDLFVLIKNGSNIKQTENIAGIPVSRIETIWNEGIDWNRVKYALDFDENKHSQYLLIENDILFSHINSDSHLGKTAIFREKNKKLIHGINLLLMRPHSDLVGLFLLYFLRFHKYSGGFLDIAQRSVNQSSINQTSLKKVALSIPSKPEQRAIVKKLESLFSSLDAGVADLKKAQQQLKIYRQAVLKKAFEGELTREWREKNHIDFNYIKWQLKDIFKVSSGINLTKSRMVNGNIPVYGGNGIMGYHNTHNYENQKLIIGRVGVKCGVTHITEKYSWITDNALIATFYSPELFDIKFMKLKLEFENLNKLSNSTAQPVISGVQIYSYLVLLPSTIEEQHQIVKQIESRLSVCDSIEQNIKDSLVKAEALRQSILKKAFEGNLLTAQELAECKQAADYEPASVLLERIKAEQNKATAKSSKKKVAQPLVVAKTETVVVKVSADIHAGLIAKVIKIHEENPASIDNLSHIKCEKIAHLVEYHLQIPLGRQPVKDAAGPDDYPHLKKIEHRAKMANYFAIQKKDIGYSYSSAKNSEKAIEKFQSALSDGKNKQLDDLIALFLKFDLEVSEIIATTYAGWNNLILNGNANPSDEEIVYESRENWSERKLKIARERFFKAIEWMRKNEIVPTGYGAVVPFPKKKK